MSGKETITPKTTAEIYNIIRHRGEVNRVEITGLSGVSKSTISLQINKLLNLGLIREKNPGGSSQKKLKLRIRPDIGAVAGVFLGITRLSIAIFDLEMNILGESSHNFESISDPAICNREIINQLRTLLAELGIEQLWGIGIGFPFPVNFAEGKPDSPPNVPLWHDYPLKDLYEHEFGCPVLVDNDVNVMALGERYRGSTGDHDNSLFIKVGTGIGSGLVVGGKIYRGANGCAGDIGHIAVAGSTTLCHCGNIGCLEAEVGGKALAVRAEEAAKSGESPFLREALARKGRLAARDINDGAIAGDISCIRIIQYAGTRIGEVAATLVNFFNPSSIVIGGGISGFGTHLISSIRESVIRRSPHLATYELRVAISELKDKSGPIGSGALILDHIFSPTRFQQTIEIYLTGQRP